MAEVKDLEQQTTELSAQEAGEKIGYGDDAQAKAAVSGGIKSKWQAMPPKKRKRLIRRGIILAVIAVAVVAGGKLLGGKNTEGETTVVTDQVTYGAITSVVKGSGVTKAKSSETITLTTAGTVIDVLVTEGQQVLAGDPLFTIDSPAALTALKKAESEVEGYEKQISALEKNLAGLNLAAGYPGKLTDVVKLNPGDSIGASYKVATLSDDTRLRLQQYYSYAYSGQIYAGQKVSVSVPALMTSVEGKVEAVHMVSRITPEGSKLFVAEIVIPNPGTLTAEMAASASITVSGGEVAYPYEAGKLEYYRTGDLTTTVAGTVISSNLVDYLQVSEGQVLVRIDGESSENQLFNLQQSLAEAQKNLETAQKNVANCNAVAPIDGQVIGLTIQPGQEVAANTAVITISNTSLITINATVDERSISYVKTGMMVDLDQWGNMFTGVVESVSLSSTVTGGVATYPMVITVDNMDGGVNVNSSINYSLVASQNDNCLVLPIQCVKSVPMEDGSTGNVVFVQGDRPDNAIELTVEVEGVPEGYWAVPVEIGIQDNYNVEIKSGVEEGTVVFTQVQATNGWG